jgi:hypothetical protein
MDEVNLRIHFFVFLDKSSGCLWRTYRLFLVLSVVYGYQSFKPGISNESPLLDLPCSGCTTQDKEASGLDEVFAQTRTMAPLTFARILKMGRAKLQIG